MARLTRRQLRAIFARLKGKQNQPRPSEPWFKSPQFSKQTLDSIFDDNLSRVYTAKLPIRHQQMSQVQHVRIWDRFVRDAPGANVAAVYSPVEKTMHISRDPGSVARSVGYSLDLPLFRRALSRRQLSGSLTERVASLRLRQIRDAKIKVRRVFYHELAHSMERNISADFLRAWNKISRRSGEWADVTPGARSLHPRTRSEELFADAYSLYASSRISRERLRRSRPLSYAYMKEFFGD